MGIVEGWQAAETKLKDHKQPRSQHDIIVTDEINSRIHTVDQLHVASALTVWGARNTVDGHRIAKATTARPKILTGGQHLQQEVVMLQPSLFGLFTDVDA